MARVLGEWKRWGLDTAPWQQADVAVAGIRVFSSELWWADGRSHTRTLRNREDFDTDGSMCQRNTKGSGNEGMAPTNRPRRTSLSALL